MSRPDQSPGGLSSAGSANGARKARGVQRLDVIGLGESMLALRWSRHGKTFDWEIAGAESNTVRYCAAHNLSTAWVSRLGTDLAGDLVLQGISADGVDVSRVARHAGHPTGVMLKEPAADGWQVRYYRTDSAATTMAPDTVDVAELLSARVLHLTGITTSLSESCRELIAALVARPRPGAATVSFDVNWRPALHPEGVSATAAGSAAEMLRSTANAADVVFVGLDEADDVWNTATPRGIRSLLPDPEMVVVKNSGHGAYALSEGGTVCVPALKGPLVGTIGAGDAFAAGVLAGMLRASEPVETWLRRGHITAMSALAHPADVGTLPDPGTINGLLSLSPPKWARAEFKMGESLP